MSKNEVKAPLVETLQVRFWLYLDDYLRHAIGTRSAFRYKQNLRIGANATIIFLSACTIEGALEELIKELAESRLDLFHKETPKDFHARRSLNFFLRNHNRDFNQKIQRTTGIENLAHLLTLFTNKKKPKKLSAFKHWEGIIVLFQLRNAIAHGREIRAEIQHEFLYKGELTESFSGGYKKAEDYLIKRKLLTHKFIANGTARHLFTNPIADHFFKISQEFIAFAEKIINYETEPMTINQSRR